MKPSPALFPVDPVPPWIESLKREVESRFGVVAFPARIRVKRWGFLGPVTEPPVISAPERVPLTADYGLVLYGTQRLNAASRTELDRLCRLAVPGPPRPA